MQKHAQSKCAYFNEVSVLSFNEVSVLSFNDVMSCDFLHNLEQILNECMAKRQKRDREGACHQR